MSAREHLSSTSWRINGSSCGSSTSHQEVSLLLARAHLWRRFSKKTGSIQILRGTCEADFSVSLIANLVLFYLPGRIRCNWLWNVEELRHDGHGLWKRGCCLCDRYGFHWEIELEPSILVSFVRHRRKFSVFLHLDHWLNPSFGCFRKWNRKWQLQQCKRWIHRWTLHLLSRVSFPRQRISTMTSSSNNWTESSMHLTTSKLVSIDHYECRFYSLNLIDAIFDQCT